MHQVDIEVILQIEKILWWIVEWFSEGSYKEVYIHCEEWWDLVDIDFFEGIHFWIAEDTIRKQLRHSCIIQIITITIANFISAEWSKINDAWGNLKILAFYVHQNFLTFIKWILQKLPPYNDSNVWVRTLK